MSIRQEKIESLLARHVGEFLSHEASPMSLITVTRVMYNEKAKKADVFITVLPETKEKTAVEFAQRKSHDLREYVREKANLGILPIFSFAIDIGEKNRQMVDKITAEDNLRNSSPDA